MRTTFLAVLLLMVVLFFTSCGKNTYGSGEVKFQDSSIPRETSDIYNFIISSEGLEPVDIRNFKMSISEHAGGFLPWVNQVRPVEVFETASSVYMVINGMGIGEVFFDNEHPFLLLPSRNSLFTDRTLGNAFLLEDQIICQIYSDTVFRDSDGTGGEASLLRFLPESGSYEKFKTEGLHDGVAELVACNVIDDQWFLCWKTSSGSGISFQYSRINSLTLKSEDIGSDEYRTALTPLPVERAPEDVRLLFQQFFNKYGTDNIIYLINWSEFSDSDNRDFSSGSMGNLRDGEWDLYPLTGLTVPEGSFLMDSEREMLWRDSRKEPLMLPELPENCTYTNFFVRSHWCLLTWEEQEFPLVGSSGVIFWRLY